MSAGEGLGGLAGWLQVRPARRPSLLGGRPPLAGRLLRGQPARAAVEHLPRLYSLCGQAHRLTAELALQAACGGAAEPSAAARLALHAETRREHLRHILLDWPRLLAGPLTVPPMPPRLDVDVDAWFEGSAANWLQGWYDDPRQTLLDWSLHGSHPLARLLHDCRGRADALFMPVRALPTDHASLLAIGRSLATEKDFVRRPEFAGEPRETGSWTRHREASPERYDTAWLRLGARLADFVALSQANPAPLAMGAMPLGEGQALAWSETARGLLLHLVQLEPTASGMRICDYQVLAPTEWNLHPRGTLALALEALPDDGLALRQAELLLAVFDPCLTYQLEGPQPPVHPENDPGVPSHA